MVVVALLLTACERTPPERGAAPLLAVRVLADTGRAERLHPTLPDSAVGSPAPAAVWLTRVKPAGSGDPGFPPAEAEPAPVPGGEGPRPSLEVDPGLKPPLLREPAPELRAPHGPGGTVQLDVRVDEHGAVSDALWAAGSSDSALIAAAVECALAMHFYPALQAGRPVAVWCRQRFDFSGR